MGDIKRIKKKYRTPGHPWNKERIETERTLKHTYGLRNKKEIWKAESTLKGIKDQIKRFPSLQPDQAARLEKQLRRRLTRLGLIQEGGDLGAVLGFSTEAILDRRLQSIVYKKGLARTAKQARQFILHEHVLVGNRCVNAPGYLVNAAEEGEITFRSSSALFNDEHPERAVERKERAGGKRNKSDNQEEAPEIVALSEEDAELE